MQVKRNPQLVCIDNYKQSIAVIRSDIMFHEIIIFRGGKILSSKGVVIAW